MEAFDHFIGPASVGHLNGIFDRAGGTLNSNFQNSQMPGRLPGGGGGGMLKLRFDRYITFYNGNDQSVT